MVANIAPVGNGQTADRRMRHAIVFYVLGSMSGGMVLGFFLTLLGGLLRRGALLSHRTTLAPVVIGFLFLLASAREVNLLKFPVPESYHQVPRSWFYRWGYNAGSFAWGSYLGVGFLTSIVSISFYAVVLWIVVVAGRWDGLSLALAYALGRVTPVIGIRYLCAHSANDPMFYINAFEPFYGVISVLNGILLAGLGSLLLTAACFQY
jgi:hypothetical protein